jgi:hypothetical protein
VIEVSDAAIGWRHRVDGEVHAPDDPFVGAPIIAALHVDADNLSGCGISDCQQTDEERR